MANLSIKRKREIAASINSIKNPVFDMGDAGPVYFQFNEKSGCLEYGGCCNRGFYACGSIAYDDTMSEVDNLTALYEKAQEWARDNA